MTTKHEQIIRHIASLNVGSKISVRQIARELNVSDGTAYRAIKEAENQGLVSTIERVGTIRIEQKKKENIEQLTFAEIVNITEGQVLGGREGLHKTLNRFLIGAMELEAMMEYTEAGSLLIVGNRPKAHELAIKKGAAVLITGGFDTDESIKELADDKKLPILSTTYDTFTVASMINRAIYDQLIKKEIILVEDILIPYEELYCLYVDDPVEKWYELNLKTYHTRFPVINEKRKVFGVVTARDIINKDREMTIDKVMTRTPLVVQPKTSLAYVAHMMSWEGIELVPIVNESSQLIGIVTRRNVLKALQQIHRQPQVGETINDIVSKNLIAIREDQSAFQANVIPQMANQLGTLSHGVFTTLVTEACRRLLQYLGKGNLVTETLTIYFHKPVQIESKLMIHPRILESGRMYSKIDVEVYHEQELVGKCLLMAQLIDQLE